MELLQVKTMLVGDSPFRLLLAALIAALVYGLARAAINVWLSPLSHVPGPRLAAASDLWGLWYQLQGTRYLKVHSLHEEYGPVVRVAPNVVVLKSHLHLPRVYHSKWDKSPSYQGFQTAGGHDNTVSTLSNAEAGGKRRGMLPHYSPSSLAQWHDPVLVKSVEEALAYLRAKGADGKAVDVLELLGHTLVDILGSIVLGFENGAVAALAQGKRSALVSDIISWTTRAAFMGRLPGLVWHALDLCPFLPPFWRAVWDSDRELVAYVAPRVKAQREGVDAIQEAPSSLAVRLSTVTNSYRNRKWQEIEVTAECLDSLLAGVETTSTSTAYMLWSVARRPDVAQKLQAEIDPVLAVNQVADLQTVARLPYLNGVIKEGLRLFAPTPASMDRVVPEGGCVFDEIALPPGTCVGIQAHTVHRDPEIFPDPHEFKPERWLDPTPAMLAAHIPFHTGNRACPGQSLATANQRLLVSALLRNFDLAIGESATEANMAQWEFLSVKPACGKCELIFTPR